MDPYEALLTSLPYTANSQDASDFADQSTEGTSTRHSTQSIHVGLDDRPHIVPEGYGYSTQSVVNDYVAPRSQWKKEANQEAAKASSVLLPSPTSTHSRPKSVASRDSWERGTVSSQTSWHTEICGPTDTSSSLYSVPEQDIDATPTQSWHNLSRTAQEQAKTPETSRRRRQADSSRTKLKHSLSDSNSTLRAPAQQQGRPGNTEQVRLRNSQDPAAPSKNLRNIFSRPADEGILTSGPIRRPNSSATTLRPSTPGAAAHETLPSSTYRGRSQRPVTPSTPETPTTPRASQAVRSMSTMSTERFVQLYEGLMDDYAYRPDGASAATSVSTLTKKRMTPEGLSLKRRSTQVQSQIQHDGNVNRIVADITRGTVLDENNQDRGSVSRRSQSIRRSPTPSLMSDSTGPSESPRSIAAHREGSRPQARPSVDSRKARVEDDARSVDSQQTTWSTPYQSQLQGREQFAWYYDGKSKTAK